MVHIPSIVLLLVCLALPACAGHDRSAVALPEFTTLLSHHPPAWEVSFDQGLAAFREARWLAAAEAFRAARGAGGDSFVLHHYAGLAALHLGHYHEASDELELAAALRPDDVATQNGLWQAYRGAGQAAKALAAFRRVVQKDPAQLARLQPDTATVARKERAVAAMAPPTREIVFPEEGDGDLLAHLHPASEPPRSGVEPPPARERPAPAGSHSLIASTYDDRQGEPAGGEAVAGAPSPPSAPPDRFAAHVPSTARPPAAAEAAPVAAPSPVAAVAPATSPSPAAPAADDAPTWRARGTALARAGHYEEAIGAYERAAQIDPKDPEVYNDLGNAYFATMEIDRAREFYRKTLKLAPDHAWALNNLGYTFFATKEYETAVQWFQRALAREPGHLFARMNLAVTYHEMGAYDPAIRELKRLLEDHPETTKAYYNLGLSYTLKGDYPHAMDAFHTYLERTPDAVERPYVERILARIATPAE